MKKFTFLVLLLISIFLISGCEGNTKPIIELHCDVDTISIGEEVNSISLIYKNTTSEYVVESSDESIATIDEFLTLRGIKEGIVTISVYLVDKPSYCDSLTFTVTKAKVTEIKVSGNTYGNVGDVLTLRYSQRPTSANNSLSFSSLNPSVASIDEDGKITLNSKGYTLITVTAETGYAHSFRVGAFDFDKIVVGPKLNDKITGNEIVIDGNTYYYEFTYLTSIKDAMKYINENGTCYVLEGSYNEGFTINKNGVKLIGKGNNISKVSNRSIIENTITIASDIKEIEISGLYFTNDAYILLHGNNDDLNINNNVFYDSSLSNDYYAAKTSISTCSLIHFMQNSNHSDNVLIKDNLFKNIQCACITLSSITNLKIVSNTFEDFYLDAIKTNLTEALDSCQWLFRRNSFKNGGYNAIYMPTFGPKVISYEMLISIYDNTFENIGMDKTNVFDGAYGAITLESFNGGTTNVNIKYNEFTSCKSVVRVDNYQNDIFSKNLDISCNYNLIKFDDEIDYLFVSFKEFNKYTNLKTLNENNIDCSYNTYLNLEEKVRDTSKYTGQDISLTQTFLEYGSMVKLYVNNVVHLETTSKIIASRDNIYYTSGDESILIIENDNIIKPLKEGKTIVKAYMMDGTPVGNMLITVKPSLNIDYASLLVTIALNEEGYHEEADGYSKYGDWYASIVGDNSFARGHWCAMFVTWCADQANIPTTIIPHYASVAAGRQWFEKRGLFKYKEEYTPKTGDLIFFLSNGASHTGIVVDYRNGTVYTIEGNTSDMCHQRSYLPSNARITGYGTPEYPVYNGTKVEFDISSSTSGEGHSTK